jgi:hypothetical protein
MRRKSYFYDQRAETEVIAVFGGAQLVKLLNGKVELRGGSEVDQGAARKWMSLFMPEALTNPPRP